jgi:hypothetical protein
MSSSSLNSVIVGWVHVVRRCVSSALGWLHRGQEVGWQGSTSISYKPVAGVGRPATTYLVISLSAALVMDSVHFSYVYE